MLECGGYGVQRTTASSAEYQSERRKPEAEHLQNSRDERFNGGI
jgi:hypothetical protein